MHDSRQALQIASQVLQSQAIVIKAEVRAALLAPFRVLSYDNFQLHIAPIQPLGTANVSRRLPLRRLGRLNWKEGFAFSMKKL